MEIVYCVVLCCVVHVAPKIAIAGAKNERQQKRQDDAKEDEYNSSNEDYSDDGDEDAESYKPGGYHPVEIGEVYKKRYQIVEKMGWGHFSTVWLCIDLQVQKACTTKDTGLDAKRPLYVAMKIQKSASHYRDAAFDEIELLQSTVVATTKEEVVKEYGVGYNSRLVVLLDDFEHQGPNGKHVCMVFEMLGENLLRVIKNFNYKGMSLEIVRNFTREICLGLDFLHRHCHIIHTDLKPENILIATPCKPKESSLKSLLESNATKTEKKGANPKQVKKTGAAVSENTNSTGNKAVTAEQKKKMKRKYKKKRQKAKMSEKKTTPKEENLFVLSPADELKEMALMEKASEPVSAKVAVSDSSAGAAGNLNVVTDLTDDVNSLDDWNCDDDVSTSSLDMSGSSYQVSLDSLSPTKQVQGRSSFSQVILRPREAQPWLRHTLLAAINFRSMQYVDDQLNEMPLDSPDAKPLSSASTLGSVANPPVILNSRSHCPLTLTAIDNESFVYPSGAMWTVIHMVSYFSL